MTGRRPRSRSHRSDATGIGASRSDFARGSHRQRRRPSAYPGLGKGQRESDCRLCSIRHLGDALEVEWRKGRKTGCGEAADVAACIVTFEYHHRKAVSFPYGSSIVIPETEERRRSFKVVANQSVWPIYLQEFDEVLPRKLREAVRRAHPIIMRRSRRQREAKLLIYPTRAIQVSNRHHHMVDCTSDQFYSPH